MKTNDSSHWEQEKSDSFLKNKNKKKQNKIDNLEITDTKTIAGTFNNFFAMIGPNLHQKLQKVIHTVKLTSAKRIQYYMKTR